MTQIMTCSICKGNHSDRLCEACHRLIFCGDRKWNDRDRIRQVMKILRDNLGRYVVIDGEATGADAISHSLADLELNLPVDPVPAEWTVFGKAAGPIRNGKMLREHRATGVVAFHDDLSKSLGTANMVQQACDARKPVWTSQMGLLKLPEFIAKLKGVR